MKMYCCQPQVKRLIACRWPEAKTTFETISTQIPTFYLDPSVQGIISVEHAETIVQDICNPTHDEKLTVVPNVVLVTIE